MAFHKINNLHTTGTILFVGSIVILLLGELFRKSDPKIFFNALLFGGILFGVSIVFLLIGTLSGIRSGKIQKRISEIWNKKN